jgi:hypothetical protein
VKAFLKIKVVSLGAEIRLIRNDVRKWKHRRNRDASFWGLKQHADWLAPKARHALIAYGFLNGKSYAEVENRCHRVGVPNWTRVEANLKYSGNSFPLTDAEKEEQSARFKVWVEEAKAYIASQTVQLKLEQAEKRRRREAVKEEAAA